MIWIIFLYFPMLKRSWDNTSLPFSIRGTFAYPGEVNESNLRCGFCRQRNRVFHLVRGWWRPDCASSSSEGAGPCKPTWPSPAKKPPGRPSSGLKNTDKIIYSNTWKLSRNINTHSTMLCTVQVYLRIWMSEGFWRTWNKKI